MLAFAKSFYRRVKKPEREKGTVMELAGMLNDCRAGYKLDHWMNGDLHLDIKVKGSNVSNFEAERGIGERTKPL